MYSTASSQDFFSSENTSNHDYLKNHRKLNLVRKNETVKRVKQVHFSADPVIQATMWIYFSEFAVQDNLKQPFRCFQSTFIDLYRGRGGKKVKRQQVYKLTNKCIDAGFITKRPLNERSGRANEFTLTDSTIKIITDSKLLDVGETASNPCVEPCTLKGSQLSQAPMPSPSTMVIHEGLPYWGDRPFWTKLSVDPLVEDIIDLGSPEKEENVINITRLPKAPPSPKPKKQSGYERCGKYALYIASEIMIDGDSYTYFKDSAESKETHGSTVKQDFNRRLGLRLEQWGFNTDEESAIKLGLDLMADLKRADYSSDQEVAENLDMYFNRFGIIASPETKKLIYGSIGKHG